MGVAFLCGVVLSVAVVSSARAFTVPETATRQVEIRRGASGSTVVGWDTSTWQGVLAGRKPRISFFHHKKHVVTITYRNWGDANGEISDFLAWPDEWIYSRFQWDVDASGQRVQLTDPPRLATSEVEDVWQVTL